MEIGSDPLIYSAWYERTIRSDDGRLIVERTPCIQGGEACATLFVKPLYFGVGNMVVRTDRGNQPHSFQFLIADAANPVEAFAKLLLQCEEACQQEMARLIAESKKMQMSNLALPRAN